MINRRIVAGGIGAGLVAPSAAQAQNPTPQSGRAINRNDSSISPNKIPDAKNVPPPSLPQDVSAALAPLRRDAAWPQTVNTFQSLYGPIPQSEGILPTSVVPAGEDPKFVTYPMKLDIAAQAAFRYNHVEILLDQASSLLDRCLSTREAWLDKATRAASFAIDVVDFLQNDAIHNEEIAAGIYIVPYYSSFAEWQSNGIRSNGAAAASYGIQQTLDLWYSEDSINKASYASQALSWLSVIPNYANQNFGEPLQNNFGGVTEPAGQRAVDSAAKLSFRTMGLEQQTLNQQNVSYEFTKGAADATATGYKKKSDWDFQDMFFKIRRTQVARDAAAFKVQLATTPNGAFNYAEQIRRYKSRFDRDLKDALARVTAAARGLQLLYNYKSPIPSSVDTCILTGTYRDAATVFEDLLEWVRDAVTFLVAFGEQDQSFTQTLSIKQMSNWSEGLSNGSWTFSIPESLFPTLSNVRVRGVNIYVRGAVAGFWEATITPPKTSTIKYFGGGSAQLDQTSFPSIRLGRVGLRADLPYHEVYGVNSLRNASPFGTWELTLGRQSTEGSTRPTISDINIDIELVARQ